MKDGSNILNFPSLEELELMNKNEKNYNFFQKKKKVLTYEEKIKRVMDINFSIVNDTNMVKQINLGNGKNKVPDVEKKRGGFSRQRNEDDFINGYFFYVNEELKEVSSNSNFGKILKQLYTYLSQISSLRRCLKNGVPSSSGSVFKDSLTIGELKRSFRMLMAYYLKIKENLIYVENDIRNYWGMAAGF